MSDTDRRITMLMVEDNSADVFFFREALSDAALPVRLYAVADGRSAMEFLFQRGVYGDVPRPDVVVLDLNLPVMNGQEVLEKMAADPELRRIPVAILTTSTFDTQLCEIYPSGQCLYFTKTDDFHRLQEIVRKIVQHAESKQS